VGTIGTKFALEGEREYKRSITEINNAHRNLNSEMKLATAQYQDNAKSVAALTARGDVLNRQLDTQQEKITRLKAALQHAERQFGATDKRTLNWQISLNKAQTELLNMESALRKNSAELGNAADYMHQYGLSEDEVTEKNSRLGKGIIELAKSFGINLPASAKKAIESIDGMAVASTALLIVSTKMIKNIVEWTKETAAYASELNNMATETGLTVEQIQALSYASEQLYNDQNLLVDSMSAINNSMLEAQNGSQQTIEAYNQLGVAYKNADGTLRDSTEVYMDVVDALSKIKDEATRDAVAMQLFGKSSKDLKPILATSREEMAAMVDEAHELGLVMGQETIRKFDQLNGLLKKFDAQSKMLEQTLAIALLPILTFLVELLTSIPTEALQIVGIMVMVLSIVIMIVNTIGKVTSSMKAIGDAAKIMNKDLWKTIGIIMAVVLVMTALAAVIAVIIGKSAELNSSMAAVGEVTDTLGAKVNEAQSRPIPAHARGTDYHPGGIALVGEEGPEIALLPRGTAVIPHKKSMDILNGKTPAYAGGIGNIGVGNTYNITVSSRDMQNVAQVVKVNERARQEARAK
jgi:hypothetical protein